MKSLDEIQEILSSEIDFLRKGRPTKVKISRANGVKGLCNSIISQFKTKLDYCKIIGKKPLIKYFED